MKERIPMMNYNGLNHPLILLKLIIKKDFVVNTISKIFLTFLFVSVTFKQTFGTYEVHKFDSTYISKINLKVDKSKINFSVNENCHGKIIVERDKVNYDSNSQI